MNVLFAGGGTGGHVYPALAVIESLRKEVKNIKIGYVGTANGLESNVIPKEPDIEYFEIDAAGLDRRPSINSLHNALKNSRGLVQSLKVIAEFGPQLIIGTGGYVSFTPLFWGSLLGIPTMIHEQNAIPGLVNRMLAPLVDRVLTSFPDTQLPERTRSVLHSGLPLRSSFMSKSQSVDNSDAKRALNLDPTRPVALFMGGTHGAASIHDEILAHYNKLIEANIQAVILAGRDAGRIQTAASSGHYPDLRIMGHTSNVGLWMRAADLMICRAGASTLAEMTAMGLPAIVIPWIGATNGHQEMNARALSEAGACRVIAESDCQHGRLLNEIAALISNESALSELREGALLFARPDATDRVVEEVRRQLDHGTSREALPLYRYWRRWHERIGMAPPSTGSFRHRFGL